MPKGVYDRVWLRGHEYRLKAISCPLCGSFLIAKRKDTLCPECKDKNLKEHWRKVEQYRDPIKRKNDSLKREYGITLDDYKKIYSEQGGCCAICGKHSEDCKQSLNVDHDHITKKVRGLLCNQCNQALGLLKDNISNLLKAINYLEKNKDA